MGNFRMEMLLSGEDILRIFKARFGSELPDHFLDEGYDFTVSPALAKRVLRTIKLTDVTLGDLAEMSAQAPKEEPATAEKLADKGIVTPFVRRRI